MNVLKSQSASYFTGGDSPVLRLSAELVEMVGLCSVVSSSGLGEPASSPSEFSNISWMRGGMDPGISNFKVITRSAPFALMLRRSVIFMRIFGNM